MFLQSARRSPWPVLEELGFPLSPLHTLIQGLLWNAALLPWGSQCSQCFHPIHTSVSAQFHLVGALGGRGRGRWQEEDSAEQSQSDGLTVRMRTRRQEQAVSRLPTQLWMHQLWPAMLPLSQTCTCWKDLSLDLRLSTSLFPLRIHPLLFNCILYRHCWPGFPLVLASLYQRQHVVMHAAAIRTPHFLAKSTLWPQILSKITLNWQITIFLALE